MLQGRLSNHFWRSLYPFLLYQLIIEGICMVIPGAGLLSATGIAAAFTAVICCKLYKMDCRIREGRTGIREIREIRNPYGWTMAAALSGVCYCIAGSCLSYIAMSRPGGSHTDNQEQMTVLMSTGPVITVLCTGILIPAAEEFVFRAMMFLRLGDFLKPPLAAVFSAVAFGLYHGNLQQGLYAGIMGLLLAGLLEKHRRMSGPLVFHIAANLTAVLINNTPPAVLIVQNEITVWLAAGISLAGFTVLLCLLYRCK